MNGGYVMVDCTGINLLADSAVTVNGIFEKVKKAMDSGKPIIAYNCQYGSGVPMSPVPVMGILEDGVYILTCSILQVRVASTDAVTIVSLVS